jgi:two-component system, NtrC family, sensor kinase
MPGEQTEHRATRELGVTALNEALMLGLVRQHELTEAAEVLNAQLQTEIAAREKAEGALVNSEKLASLGRMAAVLAHEINNPLEAVTNVLFLAQTAEGVPDFVRQYLEMADSELKRIAHITRQTLGFYRETLGPTTFAVASSLDSAIELLQARKVSKQAIVATQCDDSLLMTAIQGEVRQVLSNLLMNSLDAVKEAGRVTLRATISPGFRDGRRAIRITVADDGVGIGEGSLSEIFAPFFTTKGSVGNGLGLWVSKQIVEKHGGRIQVRSRTSGPRQGTSFSLLLPILWV